MEYLRVMRETIEFTTLGDLLVGSADRSDNSDLLIFPERRVSYGEMRDAAD